MRGLRTTTDQLCAADPALVDKLVDINQRFESVTMSVAERESEEMDSIGRLVPTQRRLLEERETLISHIRSFEPFPGFGDFLNPPSFDVLKSAALLLTNLNGAHTSSSCTKIHPLLSFPLSPASTIARTG
ncbi:hypothetical protein EDB84DRAFT_1516845 [Lactarius hengduanensis]|nr:hypothetical protein EDB84DRAFT_1516845 [Lactarius hengduanensis]